MSNDAELKTNVNDIELPDTDNIQMCVIIEGEQHEALVIYEDEDCIVSVAKQSGCKSYEKDIIRFFLTDKTGEEAVDRLVISSPVSKLRTAIRELSDYGIALFHIENELYYKVRNPDIYKYMPEANVDCIQETYVKYLKICKLLEKRYPEVPRDEGFYWIRNREYKSLAEDIGEKPLKLKRLLRDRSLLKYNADRLDFQKTSDGEKYTCIKIPVDDME